MASEVSTDKTIRQLGIWERRSATAPWLLTCSVYPPSSTQLPSTQDYRYQVALVIPPTGKGKIRILSVDGQLVGARWLVMSGRRRLLEVGEHQLQQL